MSRMHRFAWLDAARRRALGRVLRVESLEDRRLLSITVNTLVDENDGVGVGGISLRDAIAAAPAGETIDFAPALTNAGPATILLTEGELVINNDLTINGPGAALLTIDASGNDITPDANTGSGSRVFNIDDGANSLKTVAISQLRLTGGDAAGEGGAILARENLTLVDCVVAGNATFTDSQLGGGGIYSASTNFDFPNSLTLINCTITNNAAVRDEGGGIRKQAGSLVMEGCTVSENTALNYGGGISAADQNVQVQIRSSTFSANSAKARQYSGGGIFIYNGAFMLVDNTLNGNSASNGAGLYMTGSHGAVTGGVISNNTAVRGNGGGIFANSSTLTVTGSEISGNAASAGGGGFYANDSTLTVTGSQISGNSANAGGGVDTRRSSNVTFISSTISGNSAKGMGGGVSMADGSLVVLRYSTITANRSDSDDSGSENSGGLFVSSNTATLDHTIVAGNLGRFAAPSDINGAIAAQFSLIGDDTGGTIADNGGNLIGTGALPINPMLGPLADNGGSTKTHALLPGSPAIDAGDPTAMAGIGDVPPFDQRGTPFTRVYNGDGEASARIDIGAYELQGPGIAADFDDDHDIDGADFLAWQRGLGVGGAMATKDQGNADGDADVDGVDLAAWKAAFGAAEEAVAVAVVSQRSGVGQDAEDRNPRIEGRLRAALTPEIVDAAMAREQLLAASASRRLFRPRLLRRR